MQGETISSILCTSSLDTISKESPVETFKYRDKVEIPKLGYVDDVVDIHKCGELTKQLNVYTNSEINKRKLQLHTDKCHRMHVGKAKECETLLIDNWKLKKIKEKEYTSLKDNHEGKVPIDTVESHTYLGECLESSGSNHKNIQMKLSKGRGIISEILLILEKIYFGSHYFYALKMMRQSLLVSVITFQSEVWFNVTEKDLKDLESLDALLLSQALRTNAKTSHCMMLLELGIEPIRYQVMKKRALYFHHLLTNGSNKLAGIVMKEQLKNPLKGDHAKICLKDLKELDLNIETIKSMTP